MGDPTIREDMICNLFYEYPFAQNFVLLHVHFFQRNKIEADIHKKKFKFPPNITPIILTDRVILER